MQIEFINAQSIHTSLPTLYVEGGYFVENFTRPTDKVVTIDLDNNLIHPGLVETHIHLDKACIIHRCCLQQGTLTEAITQTALAKKAFTQLDIYQRGKMVIEQ